jgi:hypothetical protein
VSELARDRDEKLNAITQAQEAITSLSVRGRHLNAKKA